MKELIKKYLGYYKESLSIDKITSSLIDECIEEVKKEAKFKYIYLEYNDLFDFMKNNQTYLDYLKGASSYLIVAMTLGINIDNKTKYYRIVDPVKALVFDATASAYIEKMSDEYEKTLPFLSLSYRFCPGYQGTSIEDNRQIVKALNADKILGISFLDSSLMLPLKTMVGIIAIGGNNKKSCKGCVMFSNCKYKKEGTLCYKI